MHSVGPLQGHMSDEFIEEVVGFWEVGAKSACNFWRILLSFFTVLLIFIVGSENPLVDTFLGIPQARKSDFQIYKLFLVFS